VRPILKIIALAAIAAVVPAPAMAQGREKKQPAAKADGTPGRIAKFSATGRVEDSNVAEDDAGKIGVGTSAPTSPLTVVGVVETTGADGGIKFPDGTVKTTAGVSRTDTLMGDGTPSSPLGVAFPLVLSGPDDDFVLKVTNTFLGDAIQANAGPSGVGAVIRGGSSGGNGINSYGGFSGSVGGGYGLLASGGNTDSGVGGDGVSAAGGRSNTGPGGFGIYARGGDALGCCNGVHSNAGYGGQGVYAVGGSSFGTGRRGGAAIEAIPGSGTNGATTGPAGIFRGDVQVTGTLSKAGGSFKIDHPLDPENKYLSHSFVESPDMKNIYDGVVTLDGSGEAVVEMPEWFGALNRDYRYLLTAMGAPMPGLYVAEEMANNRFKIAGGVANMRVSWQVTGIRQDAWANQHRIPVEERKPDAERGFYLHPEAFDQPVERGVQWAYDHERMRSAESPR
jgi:hypothetical protein